MKVPWSIENLLPHRPPMILVDALRDFDPAAHRVTAEVHVTESSPFCEDGRVPNFVAIEYMAQTAGLLAGCSDRLSGVTGAVRSGLLLGTRRLELGIDAFEAGHRYMVTSETTFVDADAAAFECRIEDEAGRVVASATLNAYRPPDMKSFLKEQLR